MRLKPLEQCYVCGKYIPLDDVEVVTYKGEAVVLCYEHALELVTESERHAE